MSETKEPDSPSIGNGFNLNATEDSNTSGTENIALDPFLIECPICLEQLDQPKSLPCLHTFCLDCLSDWIVKDDNLTTFPCPICRKVTMPPDITSGKATWAINFPTNNLIVEMIRYSQNTAVKKNCDPCKRRMDREILAVRWCKICNVYLCQECEIDFHRFLHTAGETLHVSDLNQSPLRTTTASLRCIQHQKKMSLFCEDHQALVCSHCVSISHRTCGSVMTPEDYAQKLNRDDVIRTRLSDGEHVMDALVKDFSIQLELLESNKHEAERKISLESQKIGDIVCRFRDQAMNQLSKVHKEQKGILESSIQRCKSLKNSMINTSKVSGVISSGTDPVQKISIYQRGKAEINSCTQMVHDLVRPFEGKLITFEPECLHEKIESFASIGRISANNQIRDFPVPVDKWLPLSDRIANHHDTFSVKLEKDKYACSVRDILWYDDDVVLLTDANNKNVKLFSEKGEFIDVLHMDDRPWSACKLPNNRVAVTRPDAKMISIVKLEEVNTEGGNGNSANVRTDIPFKKLGTDSTNCTGPDQVPSENNTSQDPRRIISLTLENSITTNLNCYGICHVGDMFVVSNGKYRPYQLYTVAPDGRTDLIMEHESPSYYITRSITEQDIVVGLTSSVPGNVALYCLKSHSSPERINISPATEKTLNNAYGMDVDRDGNIYLCCGGPMGVVQVTSDRETVRELVGVEQGIKDPRAISVLHNKVVVTDVAKENANIVKIFHLR